MMAVTTAERGSRREEGGSGGGDALAVALLWGFLVEPRLIDRQPREGSIPGLPAAWEGAEVAFISDFQIGIWLDNIGTARRMVTGIVEERPDVVLLGGDYVYSDSPGVEEQVRKIVDLFLPLKDAGLPTYAVLGNHDVEQEAGELLERGLEAIGIPVLSNEVVALPSPDGASGPPLHLVAVAPHLPEPRDDPAAALSAVPDGRRGSC